MVFEKGFMEEVQECNWNDEWACSSGEGGGGQGAGGGEVLGKVTQAGAQDPLGGRWNQDFVREEVTP